MSKKKKSKKNYKQFTITTVENGAVALGSLLSAVASNLKKYKETAEAYKSIDATEEKVATDAYQVTFVGENGQTITKRFSRVDYGSRGKLLFNMVTDAIESMGQSISEQEKRQIIPPAGVFMLEKATGQGYFLTYTFLYI